MDSPVVDFNARTFEGQRKQINNDNVLISLSFESGDFGTIHYVSNGGSSFPKERIEVFSNEGTLVLDNFKQLRGFNWPLFRKMSLSRQDKGHKECVKSFIESIANGDQNPIPLDDIFRTSELAISISDSLFKKN